jgi:predicted ATP-grasp superfamily ATP-dependent carboligase
MRIMISADASPVAPGIIRHLQSLGHWVLGHDSQQHVTMTGADKHVRSPPVSNGGGYLRFLRNFEKSYDLYIPFLDEELRLFGLSGEPINCCIRSPNSTLVTFTSKIFQQRELEKVGLPVAPSVEIVIKPDHGRGGRGVIKSTMAGGVVVQHFMDGPEFTIDALADMDGKFLFAVPRQRIAADGVSTIGRITMDEDLIGLAQLVMGKFRFAGPINIQVIRSSLDDVIIEINPRLSGSCIMTVMAGWDILADSIAVFEGKPFKAPDRIEEIMVRRTYVEERL